MVQAVTAKEVNSLPDSATIAGSIKNFKFRKAVSLALDEAANFIHDQRQKYKSTRSTSWNSHCSPKSPSFPSLCDSGYNSQENTSPHSPQPASPNAQADTETWIDEHTELTGYAPSNDLPRTTCNVYAPVFIPDSNQFGVPTQEEDHDSGVELSSISSKDESELSIVLPPESLKEQVPPPNLKGLEDVSLAVYSDEYETHFFEAIATNLLPRQICAFGECTTDCVDSPCYCVDHMIEYNPTITDDLTIKKTTCIYLDITGKAALIYLPRSKRIRLLAQELQSIVTDVIDIQELDDCPSKYRYEIDITKFTRSSTPFVIYSTFPIRDFYRDLEDEIDGDDPRERPQFMLTQGRGAEVHVPNLFLGTKQEFDTHAEQFEFAQDQRDIVTFHNGESDDDFLNELNDFGSDAPPDRKEGEESEYIKEEQLVRNPTLVRFKESKKFARETVIADTKDVILLYCMENADRGYEDGKGIVLSYDQAHQTTQEEKDLLSWEELSWNGAEMNEKTKSPDDKDRTVHRVVAWLSQDDSSYAAIEDDHVSTCNCEGCFNDFVFVEKQLSPAALTLYESLALAAIDANQETSESPQAQGTYEFTLVNLVEKDAAAHKKHIYLATASSDTEIRFSPCTQKLLITSPTITACHELDPTTLQPTLIGTKVHVPTMTTINCMIYSTQPISKYTLDYTLPEVKDAPRQSKKELVKYLRQNCEKYEDFAPYAANYKFHLGNVVPKTLKCEIGVLGEEEGEEEGEEQE